MIMGLAGSESTEVIEEAMKKGTHEFSVYKGGGNGVSGSFLSNAEEFNIWTK